MVNLYEFLGLVPTASVDDLEKAIEQAQLQGKDAKLILACRNILLNEARRAQYNKSMKLEPKHTVKFAPKSADVKAEKVTSANTHEVFKKSLNGKQIGLIVGGILVFGLVMMPVMNKLSDNSAAKAELNRVADEIAEVKGKGSVLCGDLAKREVKYPGTFERTSDHIMATQVVDEGSGHYSILLPFSANNGLNVPVEHIAVCKIDARGSGGIKLISVS